MFALSHLRAVTFPRSYDGTTADLAVESGNDEFGLEVLIPIFTAGHNTFHRGTTEVGKGEVLGNGSFFFPLDEPVSRPSGSATSAVLTRVVVTNENTCF